MAVSTPIRDVVRFGVFEVDLRSGELRKNGVKVKLQDQPFQVLRTLLEHPGEVVTREELRQKLWPVDTFVDFDDGLNTATRKLRDSLGDSAENPRFIETMPRRGYRFIAPVNGATATAAVPPHLAADSHGYQLAILVGLAVALAVAVVAVTTRQLHELKRGSSTPGLIHSIAVLPLENLTGDSGQEYFVDGMTDALITDLAQIQSLHVISRTSVMQYKGTRKRLPDIARELNVDAVVEGSVVRSEGQVRIDAQLIQAANDRHVWAKSYQSQPRDVVSMQNDIARTVAEEIQAQITPEEKSRLTAPSPVNPEAYEEYLKGRYYQQKWTSASMVEAINHFQNATLKDPNYALAYVGVARAEYFRPFSGPIPPRVAMPRAAEAARKALQLDPSSGDAHGVLAAIKYRFEWDWAGAEAEFRQALELNRNSADSDAPWEQVIFLRTANRYQEAMDAAMRLKERDPILSQRRAGLGSAYLIARKYDLAIQELRPLLARNPESANICQLLGVAYEQKGLAREAISTFEQCVNLSRGDPTYLALLAHAYATFGRRQDAEKILAELQQRAKREYVSPYNIALVWLGLGKKQQALAWLEKAYVDHSFQLVTINSWPWFDQLRSKPQFQDLVRRIGLDPDRALPR